MTKRKMAYFITLYKCKTCLAKLVFGYIVETDIVTYGIHQESYGWIITELKTGLAVARKACKTLKEARAYIEELDHEFIAGVRDNFDMKTKHLVEAYRAAYDNEEVYKDVWNHSYSIRIYEYPGSQ